MHYKLLLVFLLLISLPASAQNKSPYKVEPKVEIPFTLGVFMAVGTPRLFSDEFVTVSCYPDCDPNDVNSFDRTVIGYHSDSARTVSDVVFIGSMALPHALGVVDQLVSESEDGWIGYGNDTLVLLETLIFTLSLNNMIDLLIRRPRPLVYDIANFDDNQRSDSSSALSFPSGHTAVPFALATAYSRLYMMRHPESPFIVPIWIGTHSLGVAAGLGRVFAGEHFWTDILIGATMGSGMGLLVPWLHEKDEEEQTAWQLAPQFYKEGGGLSFQQGF